MVASLVHGPHSARGRRDFWEELKHNISEPWMVAGDFNLSLEIADRKGKQSHLKDMEEFCDIIHELQLMDISLLGRRFAWSNKIENPSMAKLERSFCL